MARNVSSISMDEALYQRFKASGMKGRHIIKLGLDYFELKENLNTALRELQHREDNIAKLQNNLRLYMAEVERLRAKYEPGGDNEKEKTGF